ncbi:DNA-processing protein DprA [Senegalia massiliensis]|uniref:DNA-protecting protein DprA n=1 Tax=Senegalia massiliensis TaxID=1720316 RepID=A0A845QX20_9CLOT|nr:DNA-processing protein DprA [Senegalia massiliensis]NBI06831.1 DNA-protecting protein DprA [Senegalia massiliensis]
MNKYLIALKELKVNNELILKMLKIFQLIDFKLLFEGKYLDIEFKHNIKFDKYANTFSDVPKLNDAIKKAKEIIALSKENKIKITNIKDKKYPYNLKLIDNPPAILYYKGRAFYKKHRKSIACVGTRSITSFGINASEAIIPSLVKEGFTIISGLAIGIDTVSHKICLDNGGTAIAVLAHGLDAIYPKSNKDLYNRILENNGLVVSEYPIGTKPDKFRFVERNRLVSGLSKGTIVFETKEKSGTMHTVNYTLEQDKPVFCPLPQEAGLTTTALIKLIQQGKAISIPSQNAFERVVLGTGYKIKDKDKVNKLKKKSASNIINSSKIDYKELDKAFNFDEKKYSGIRVDKDLYLKYREVLKENNLTNKEMFNAFMLSVINSNSSNKK